MGHPRVLRSKSPEMVRQELWGFLLTHYAIRDLIREAQTTLISIPTGYRSSATYGSSAARSPTKRDFPPERLANSVTIAISEINERPNPPRRHRTYPRVAKRTRLTHQLSKHPWHIGRSHLHPPILTLRAQQAN